MTQAIAVVSCSHYKEPRQKMLLRYVLKKAGIFILTLFCVSTATFVLMHVIPGDPFLQEQAIPDEILEAMKAYYGLDKPLLTQYISYLNNLLHGDLGPSFKYGGRSVSYIIAESAPISFILGLEALFLSLTFGITIGSLSALFKGKWIDKAVIFLAVFLISVPNFMFASALQFLLSMKLNLFPVARWGTFAHTVLPALSLAALPSAYIARLLRANMLENLKEEYILTARAKGITTWMLWKKHLLKNSILPVITYLGPLAGTVLTGSFIIEKIFGIPGLGNWFISAISNRDYTLIMGVTLFYSFVLLLCMFIVEILYPLIDPRIVIFGEKR